MRIDTFVTLLIGSLALFALAYGAHEIWASKIEVALKMVG